MESATDQVTYCERITMAVIRTDLVRIIEARDEHGTPRKVFVYRKVFHRGTPESPGVETRGPETMFLDDGRDVSALDAGRYRVAISGNILVGDVPTVG
jgi:hypothetical protein